MLGDEAIWRRGGLRSQIATALRSLWSGSRAIRPRNDGAQVGQILESYSYVMNDDNDEGADFFKRQKTGQVRVEELVDDHFAKVSVLEGVVKKHDLVLLIQ